MKDIVEYDKQIEMLKREMLSVGMAISGSIHTMYRRCGKQNCRCSESETELHGPYYVWYRRVDGKLTTKSIEKKHLAVYEEWIKNRAKLESIMKKLIDVYECYAVKYKPTSNNSQKNTSPTRGK